MIIDDDKELCEELSEILKDEGFEVESALTPDGGKNLLKSSKYDILILDFKLPQISGVELLAGIKGMLSNTKVFFISGSLAVKDILRENHLSSLVSGVFRKPFSIEELLKELKS